ncbi:MAG: DUF4418 family protein [Bacillota bacterium]|nr:DUF4418 family protein [Bacillota bacterium]
MKRIKSNILTLLILIIGAVTALTPWHLFKVCGAVNPMAKHMKCYYTGKLVLVTGIVIVILSLLCIIFNRRSWKLMTGFLTMLLAAANYLLSNEIVKLGDFGFGEHKIGFCMMENMSCVQNTKPALGFLLPALFVLGLALLIQGFLTRKERGRRGF